MADKEQIEKTEEKPAFVTQDGMNDQLTESFQNGHAQGGNIQNEQLQTPSAGHISDQVVTNGQQPQTPVITQPTAPVIQQLSIPVITANPSSTAVTVSSVYSNVQNVGHSLRTNPSPTSHVSVQNSVFPPGFNPINPTHFPDGSSIIIPPPVVPNSELNSLIHSLQQSNIPNFPNSPVPNYGTGSIINNPPVTNNPTIPAVPNIGNPSVGTQNFSQPPPGQGEYTYINTAILQTLVSQFQQMMTTLASLVDSLNRHRPYRVAPIGKFHVERGEPLPRFLDKFEEYASLMYPDSTPEGWLPLLESHLEGEAKQAYNALIRNATSYTHLKNGLLDWFREKVQKQSKEHTTKFYDAKIQTNETIPIYALRLLGLADRAFPGNDPKKLKTVQEKLLTCLPPEQQKVVRSQITVCEVAQGGKPLAWDGLIHLMDQYYPRVATSTTDHATASRRSSGVTVTPQYPTPPSPPIQTEVVDLTQPEVVDLAVYQPEPVSSMYYFNQNGPQTSNIYTQPPQPLYPSYAQMAQMSATPPLVPQQPVTPPPAPQIPTTPPPAQRNQQRPQQQLRQRNNPRSRSQQRSQTPPQSPRSPHSQYNQNNPNNRTPASPRQNVQCNYCKSEGHDVRECPQRPYCLYCGKRGHVSEECYASINKCIRCQQLGHVVADCPERAARQQARSTVLCCPKCRGGHLGINCPQSRSGNF